MRLRTYILFVVLLSLLGLCTVHEVISQMRMKYRLAELLRQEDQLKMELKQLRDVDLARLQSPENLERLIRDMDLKYGPLKPLREVELAPLVYHQNR